MARPSKAMAIERLQKALDAIPELMKLGPDSPEFKMWRRNTQVAFTHTFGNESSQIREFNKISFPAEVFLPEVPTSLLQNAYLRGLKSATLLLKSVIEEVKEYWEDGNQRTPVDTETLEIERIKTNQVFIIHGRDDGTKETVARFLEKIDLEPVILHERPDGGRTIIEKFEQHADVRFAVALLTPDDVGALKGDESNLNPRARQNVIFEFGYLLGRLGRQGVRALTKGLVDIPSDYAGVLYIPLDDGWKMGLIRELKHAGFEVDANKAFEA